MFYKRPFNPYLAPMTQEMWSSTEILSTETELTALKLSFVLKCGVLTLSCRSEAQSASSLLQHSSTLESVKQSTSQSRAPPGEDAPITNVHFKAVGKRDL